MGDQGHRDKKYAKLECRDTYDGHWKTGLPGAIGEAPLCECPRGWHTAPPCARPTAACTASIPQPCVRRCRRTPPAHTARPRRPFTLPPCRPPSPAVCCASLWCSWCVSYSLRKRALHGDMSR